jgi:hypothetical protein
MNIASDLAINLLATFIGVVIAWIWDRVRKGFRLWPLKKIWGAYAEDRPRVIVGRYLENKQFEPTGFLGVGDAIAISELRNLFTRLNGQDLEILYSDQVSGDVLKENLILVGGPEFNLITREVMDRLKTSIRFGNPRLNEIAFHDTCDNRVLAPKVNSISGEVIKDYGLVVRAKNPFAPEKWVTVIAGSFGFGSWAGARYAASGEMAKRKEIAGKKEYELLVECEVVGGSPQNVKAVVMRVL